MLGCRMDMRDETELAGPETVDPVITGQESFTQLSPEISTSTDRLATLKLILENMHLNRVWNS